MPKVYRVTVSVVGAGLGTVVADPTKVPLTRAISTTLPIRINGTTSGTLASNPALSIDAASASVAGSMSAAHWSKLNDLGTVSPSRSGIVPLIPGDSPSYLGTLDGLTASWIIPEFWQLQSVPDTLAGYGITDAVPSNRTISTTAPLAGGGDLSANRTLTVSAATTGTTGVVQLAGDLAGSATSVTVAKANGASVPAAGALTTGHVLQVTGASALGYGFATNSNISTSAAIDITKLSLGGTSQFITSNGSVNAWSAMTGLLHGELSGGTLHTQVSATSEGFAPVAGTDNSVLRRIGGSIGFSQITNALISSAAAITVSKLDAGGTANRVVVTTDGTTATWSSWSTIMSGPLSSGIQFDSAYSTPKVTQADVTTAAAHGIALNVTAQNSTGTGATVGGALVLTSGSGATAGPISLALGGTNQGLTIYDSGSLGGADPQIISTLPIFFLKSGIAMNLGDVRFGFDNAHRSDPSLTIGRGISIEAESIIDPTSTAGTLHLSSGQGYYDSTTGSVQIHTGTTLALTLSPDSCAVFGAPAFPVSERVKWFQIVQASTTQITRDVTIATDGAYQIDLEVTAKGGSIYGSHIRYYASRASGAWVSNVNEAVTTQCSPACSPFVGFPNGTTIRVAVTPGNATSTTWTLKVTFRVS